MKFPALLALVILARLTCPTQLAAADSRPTTACPEHVAVLTSPPGRVPTRGMSDGPLLY